MKWRETITQHMPAHFIWLYSYSVRCAANSSFAFCNFLDFNIFFPNIYYLWLVRATEAEVTDAWGCNAQSPRIEKENAVSHFEPVWDAICLLFSECTI